MHFSSSKTLKKLRSAKKVAGFSLPDLLVAMLITGILLSLVIPSRQQLVTKAKAMEAKVLLSNIKTCQESYYYENSRYTTDISELDFTPTKTIEEGGNAVYRVTIVDASGQGYTARATALKDFDGDGIHDTWEVTQEGKITNVTKD